MAGTVGGRSVLTTTARDALAASTLLDGVQVGDAGQTLRRTVPSDQGGLTDAMEAEIAEEYPGDAGTVRAETERLLLEADEFERQVDAVVAVAEAADAAVRTASTRARRSRRDEGSVARRGRRPRWWWSRVEGGAVRGVIPVLPEQSA